MAIRKRDEPDGAPLSGQCGALTTAGARARKVVWWFLEATTASAVPKISFVGALPSGCTKNLSVDLDTYAKLLVGKVPFPHRVEVERPFPNVDPTLAASVLDRRLVQCLRLVSNDASQGPEDLIGRKAEKLLNADVSNRSRRPVLDVPENTDFVDRKMPTQTLVRIVLTIYLF